MHICYKFYNDYILFLYRFHFYYIETKRDLYKLEVELKCEFNASKTDIIDEKSKIISS